MGLSQQLENVIWPRNLTTENRDLKKLIYQSNSWIPMLIELFFITAKIRNNKSANQ